MQKSVCVCVRVAVGRPLLRSLMCCVCVSICPESVCVCMCVCAKRAIFGALEELARASSERAKARRRARAMTSKVDFRAVEAAIKQFMTSEECIDYDKDTASPDPSKCKAHKRLLTALHKATWHQTPRCCFQTHP